MGTVNIPVQSAQERKAWNDGLARVIKELRDSNHAMDGTTIASRIAEFRREFLKDPTRIIMLL